MKGKFSRLSATSSLVSVYRFNGDGVKVLLRFEKPDGTPCDEYGVPLGVVKFKYKGVLV